MNRFVFRRLHDFSRRLFVVDLLFDDVNVIRKVLKEFQNIFVSFCFQKKSIVARLRAIVRVTCTEYSAIAPATSAMLDVISGA